MSNHPDVKQVDERVGVEPTSAVSNSRNLVGAVLKAVNLVEAFQGGQPELTLTELTRRTGYPTPTVHRLLATLEHAGWLSRGRSGGYLLSIHMAEIARHVLSNIDLRDEALREMQTLTRQTGETSYLMVREAHHAVCIERVESYNMVRIMSTDVGSVLPLYVGASPLALLAHQPPDEIDLLLGTQPFQSPRGITMTPDEVKNRMAKIRIQGFSLSVEEMIPGIASIGAPIFDAEGKVAAGISIGGLASTLTGERMDEFILAVRETGNRISQNVGHTA
jgi:DNA-binding IclR family transcriptional regulator